jgi:hypothetical protein
MKMKGRLPDSVTAELHALAGLTPEQVDTVLQLICLPENGSTDYDRAHEYCSFLGDGRGYTCSLYGACSGTGDLCMVFDHLAKIAPGHRLLEYHAALKKCRGDHIHGIEPLGAKAHGEPRNLIPNLTKANGGKPDMAWRAAAWRVYIDLYWTFAKRFCDKTHECAKRPGPALTTDLAYGFLVDVALNHGPDMDSFRPVLKEMKRQPSDETEWLREFATARASLLKSGFQDLDTSKTGDRCGLWLDLLDAGNTDLRRPIKCAKGYWGSGYTIS